ncbi:MAG: exo-alpha-sialidase [Clostridia bacterium]|nr:exo-alpha-sialidase [Clostridia bacterium]
MNRDDGYIRYIGNEEPDLEKHDGGLRPVVGAWNVQVLRANRAHPELADGVGNTYNHAPNITYWHGRFYLAYLSNPVSEHTGTGQTFLCESEDALKWTKPRVLFPPYPLNPDVDNGPHSDLFEDGACACMHQRMNFYIAPDGRLLAFGFYGLAPEVATMPCVGNGIGRFVREIYEDGTLGEIYLALPSQRCGYNEDNCLYPIWCKSPDAGFRKAVEAALNDKLNTLQWWEENRDYGEADFFALRGAGEAFNWYALPDGKIVGLWKRSKAALSEDGGRHWSEVKTSPSLVMSGGKQWGERTSDGRYALLFNPNTDSCHRWPLAVVTSDDGIEFDNMLSVHGEVPLQRYWGFWRDCGPNYVRGLEGGAASPDGALYVCYSVNKEDIWISRVPVPIKGRVTEHVSEDFSACIPRRFVPWWNAYSPAWCPVSLETVREADGTSFNALRMKCKDPYDYAKVTRVFPESERVRLRFSVMARQNYFGRLEIDLEDHRGACVFRVIVDSDRTVKLKHGNGFSIAGLYGGRVDLTLEVDCVGRSVSASFNGSKAQKWRFFNSARTVERLVFRTGTMRRRPYLDEDREFLPPEDLPGSGEALIQESVYYICSFSSEAMQI